jgi:hypothetical protein
MLSIFALSCGQASQNTGVLNSMLSSIPSELASNNILWFSNMERIKELAGVDPDTDMNEFIHVTGAELQLRQNLIAGCFLSEFSGESHMEYWPDAFGYNTFDTRQEIMVESPIKPNTARPLFSVMKGNFDQNLITGKLDNLGYQLKNHESTDYYSINDDYQISKSSSSAAGMASFF